MQAAVLTALNEARRAKHRVAVVTRLSDGTSALVVEDAQTVGDLPLDTALLDAAANAIRKDKAQRVEIEGASYFINTFNPPLRMMVIGAVHIAQALAPMAKIAGFDVTLIDPRSAWATEERFPDVTLNRDWPDDALTTLAPDRRSAVVALTHDPKIDEPALEIACRSEAFYIGALGSRKTHAARLDLLHNEAGLSEAETNRISGPIGLDIGAVSPAEIATSILAEVIQALRAPKDAA